MSAGRPFLLRIDSTTASELMITFSISPAKAPARVLSHDHLSDAKVAKQHLDESKVY